jgi:uncharacterized protein YcbX
VCGDTVCCTVLAAAVAGEDRSSDSSSGGGSSSSSAQDWFQRAIGVRCTLAQQRELRRARRAPQQQQQQQQQQQGAGASASSAAGASPRAAAGPAIGFANEAQLLLVSAGSVSELGVLLRARDPAAAPLNALRFRPNLVVSGAPAFCEDGWRRLEVGGAVGLEVVGPCGRCEMVQVDQGSGSRQGSALMRVLAESRRRRGRLEFGLLLAQREGAPEGGVLRVGDRVKVEAAESG